MRINCRHVPRLIVLGLVVSAMGPAFPVNASESSLSLAGEWSFRLDPQGIGERENWATTALPQTIRLPGSTAQAGYGDDITTETRWTGDILDKSWFTDARHAKYRQSVAVKVPFWLQPVKHYVGPAWYQRQVTIPRGWAGQRIVLWLERCHWETRVWVDGREAGRRDSLAVPHEYDLTRLLSPGEHTLAIRVDNTIQIDVGVNAHSVSDHTQSNWNGIIGRMELRAGSPIFIEDVQVYPDPAEKKALVQVKIANNSGQAADVVLSLQVRPSYPQKGEAQPTRETEFPVSAGVTRTRTEYSMGERPLLWDEFSPHIYTLDVSLTAGGHTDRRSVDFGMRSLGVEGTQFTINGRKTFIRGTLECCIFPLTGYPPTDVESWMRILRVAKAHGLNQLRFHSWCPPEAAFIAGDRLGFMHQVECGVWTRVGDGGKTDEFVKAEAQRILKAYGNHPSFCFLAHGNEPSGPNHARFLAQLVTEWKTSDPRRLYTSAAGWPLIRETDYHSTPEPRIQQWGQGLSSRINARPPETASDYRDFVARHADKPAISHEIGQWCVYPDFKEIDKYTGVLKARNFEIFRDGLREKHMADQAEAFLIASGKLQTLCYKEDIESALRTPGFGGFQLLDLHDFPGQGTALVGVLNPFWESKGYVTAEEYHRFCCETVPLARLKKRVWTSDETFEATLEIAHFGPAPIRNALVKWLLFHKNGAIVEIGDLPVQTVQIGNGQVVGTIQVPLAGLKTASPLKLMVGIDETRYVNDWDVWVYPRAPEAAVPEGVVVAEELDDAALTRLRQGGTVLLLPARGRVAGDEHGVVPPGFSSIFWNTAWTRRQAPHTLGILCDPKHPALAQFPTDSHSNWQWWELVHDAQIMILDELPPRARPIVQVIDDWVTNRRLGLLFEARVEGGKLLMCGMDIQSDLASRHVARQMRQSLMAYLQSEAFSPSVVIERRVIEKILSGRPCPVVNVDSAAEGHEGCLAADGNPATIWHTPWGEGAPGYPHELQLKLEKESVITGISYLPRQDMQNGWISRFEVYVSNDGQQWPGPAAHGRFDRNRDRKEIRFAKPARGRYVRFVALEGFNEQPYASIAEIEVVTDR